MSVNNGNFKSWKLKYQLGACDAVTVTTLGWVPKTKQIKIFFFFLKLKAKDVPLMMTNQTCH